jgi:hypothetical protein
MKNYFFAAVAASALLFSCKKNDKETLCDNTVAALAGNYKVTKVTIAGQDVTNTLISEDCIKDDIYQLKADKTVTYVDAGTKCNPAGDGTGDWDVVSGTISIDHTGYGITVSGTVKNKCNGFEVSQTQSGVTYLVSFTKQ